MIRFLRFYKSQNYSPKATEDEYLVTNKSEILAHFADLKRKRVALDFASENTPYKLKSFVVDLLPMRAAVVVDASLDHDTNLKICDAVPFSITANHDGIECSFLCDEIGLSSYNGENALLMKIPQAMRWVERRDFLRIPIPVSHLGSYCEFRSPRLHGKLIRIQLFDLHCEGFSLLNQDDHLQSAFIMNDQIRGLLHLHEEAYSSIQFLIRHVDTKSSHSKPWQQLIGCEFDKLPPCFETSIQHYIQGIQIHESGH